MTIIDYYKYALLATAAYVRAGNLVPGSNKYGQDFVQLANDQAGGRLPLSIGRALFNPNFALEGLAQWQILNYYGSDKPNVGEEPGEVDPIASGDKTGFGATLFGKGDEKVLALRGTEPNERKQSGQAWYIA